MSTINKGQLNKAEFISDALRDLINVSVNLETTGESHSLIGKLKEAYFWVEQLKMYYSDLIKRERESNGDKTIISESKT